MFLSDIWFIKRLSPQFQYNWSCVENYFPHIEANSICKVHATFDYSYIYNYLVKGLVVSLKHDSHSFKKK